MAIQEKNFFVSSEMCQDAAQKTNLLDYINKQSDDRVCKKVTKLVGAQLGIMGVTTALTTGGCAGAGALIGLAGGPVAPISVPICAGIGIGVGLIASAIAGPVLVAELPCAEDLSQDYNGWKQGVVQEDLISQIQKKYPDDPLFKSIQDTVITYDFLKEPVLTPCGHTLEKSFILEYVKQNPVCPSCTVPLDKEKLTTDYVMIGKSKKIFAALFTQETQNPSLSASTATDLSQIAHRLNQEAKDCYLKESEDLTARLKDNSITVTFYKNRMKQLMDLLD